MEETVHVWFIPQEETDFRKKEKERRTQHVTFGGSCIDSLTDGKEKDEGVIGRGTKGYKDGQLGHTVQGSRRARCNIVFCFEAGRHLLLFLFLI